MDVKDYLKCFLEDEGYEVREHSVLTEELSCEVISYHFQVLEEGVEKEIGFDICDGGFTMWQRDDFDKEANVWWFLGDVSLDKKFFGEGSV